jgi:hypothetical protein
VNVRHLYFARSLNVTRARRARRRPLTAGAPSTVTTPREKTERPHGTETATVSVRLPISPEMYWTWPDSVPHGPQARPEFARWSGSARVLYAHRPLAGARCPLRRERADVAQLVEHHLAKVRVAGSNPVVRSEVPDAVSRADGPHGSSVPWRCPTGGHTGGGMAEWLRQGPAKPCTRVRFPLPPRGRLAQRESASLTRKRSLVQSQYRPLQTAGQRPVLEDEDWPS